MLNQVVIQGNLCRDAEIKQNAKGKTFVVFCVAVGRNYRNTEGKYDADFIDCVAYEKIGDHIAKYFHKGSEIIVSGELQTNVYNDKNGVKHKASTINVSKVYFSKNSGNVSGESQATASSTQAESSELPFE